MLLSVLTGTPLNANVGNHNVVITATDISGASNTQSFTINVAQSFDVHFSGVLILQQQKKPYSYKVTTTDVDVGDTVVSGTVTPLFNI